MKQAEPLEADVDIVEVKLVPIVLTAADKLGELAYLRPDESRVLLVLLLFNLVRLIPPDQSDLAERC